MSSRPNLKLAWCSHEAARFACENWHYSKSIPAGKLVRVGAWEDGEFIGAVIFGRGANNNIGSAYGLDQTEACELVRIALRQHRSPVSRIGAIALRMLTKASPGLRLVVSYADPAQEHHGGIYQAMNWLYAGRSQAQRELLVTGRFMHKRTATARYGTASPDRIRAMTGLPVEYGPLEWKHTYLYPLDDEMRQQLAPLAKPYPKRASEAGDDPIQGHSGSATLTRTLQPNPKRKRTTTVRR